MANDSFMIFTGTANTRLAVDVVNHLDMSLGKMTVGRFSDGEVMVEINENVRGKDVFVLQPTCAPTNDNLMEIMVMVDALRRASAGRITAAIPYFGYARQDRRPRSARVAISAKVVANMLQVAGVDRVLTMDLHADQIQGSSTSRSTTSMPVRSCWATSGAAISRTWWWCRPISAAWCAPARWPSSWKPTWPSSTSAVRAPTCRK
ncbi:ribose phosphate pyrophosphokinase N-terminal domain protein [Bordetella bronchiseptica SBL-F6116]|nr:ribose phosphate pyrophosphokinase N-terminal domain protein [Bordetella bronchiseptica SBL-F6116]